MAPAFYLKYAIFQRKISSWVKSDPPIQTALQKAA